MRGTCSWAFTGTAACRSTYAPGKDQATARQLPNFKPAVWIDEAYMFGNAELGDQTEHNHRGARGGPSAWAHTGGAV